MHQQIWNRIERGRKGSKDRREGEDGSAIDKSPIGKHLNKNMSATSKHRFQTLKLLDGCIQMLPSNKYYVVYTSRKVLKFVIKHNFLCKTDSTMLYLGWSTH